LRSVAGDECREMRMGRSIGSDARSTRAAGLRDTGRLRSRTSRPRRFHGLAAVGLVCLSALSATRADAAVAVDGGRDDMQVRVENDSVDHVLEALSQKGNLHYRSTRPLNKVIGGSFSGSLAQVVSRILVGFDFVVRYSPPRVEIFVFGESGEAPSQAPPTEASPTAQTASPVAEQAAVSITFAPRYMRHAPTQYDVWTASRIPACR
jgi:hypothetical protein